jgi:pyruvate formate lyase activating enzyme
MNIGGFQQTSLIDYPDKLCAIIWTLGCNFRCPFCYNPQLVLEQTPTIAEEDVLAFLQKRTKQLDALSISGGEPLLQPDLAAFIKKVKKLGYLIKIDTNGSLPDTLAALLDQHLIDYVSMDIKAPPDTYKTLTGKDVDITKIQHSIQLIKEQAPAYEFRTTMIPSLLTKEDIITIAQWITPATTYYIQQFKYDTPVLSPQLQQNKPYPRVYLEETLKAIKPYFTTCALRGI